MPASLRCQPPHHSGDHIRTTAPWRQRQLEVAETRTHDGIFARCRVMRMADAANSPQRRVCHALIFLIFKQIQVDSVLTRTSRRVSMATNKLSEDFSG